MVNKKGYVKTLEAIAAILILYLLMSSILAKNKPEAAIVPKDIELVQATILNEIESNNYYRNCILGLDYGCIDGLISSTIQNRYYYNFTMCDTKNCPLVSGPNKEVYAKSIIVSSNLTKYKTTSVNLLIWRKI